MFYFVLQSPSSTEFTGDDLYNLIKASKTTYGFVKTRYVNKNVFKKSMLKNLKSASLSNNLSTDACLIYWKIKSIVKFLNRSINFIFIFLLVVLYMNSMFYSI